MKQQLSKLTIFSIVFIFTIISVFGFENKVNAQIPPEYVIDLDAIDGLGSGGGSNSVVGNPLAGSGGSGGGSDYVPITPGYRSIFGNASDLGSMLSRLFQISITLTIVLAVLMMIIGGIQYMGSESMFKKDEGKQRIFAAIGGLLIALVSILIISTILPGGNGDTFDINIFE